MVTGRAPDDNMKCIVVVKYGEQRDTVPALESTRWQAAHCINIYLSICYLQNSRLQKDKQQYLSIVVPL